MINAKFIGHSDSCPVSQPGFRLPTKPDGTVDVSGPSQCTCDFLERLATELPAGEWHYKSLSVNCSISQASLGMAAVELGPAFIYDLHVSPSLEWAARMTLRELSCDTGDNPFTPYVNLRVDSRNSTYEWYLCANGKAVGSVGVA